MNCIAIHTDESDEVMSAPFEVGQQDMLIPSLQLQFMLHVTECGKNIFFFTALTLPMLEPPSTICLFKLINFTSSLLFAKSKAVGKATMLSLFYLDG